MTFCVNCGKDTTDEKTKDDFPLRTIKDCLCNYCRGWFMERDDGECHMECLEKCDYYRYPCPYEKGEK